MSHSIGQLRSLIAQGPSKNTWEKIVSFFGELGESAPEREQAITYAQQHLKEKNWSEEILHIQLYMEQEHPCPELAKKVTLSYRNYDDVPIKAFTELKQTFLKKMPERFSLLYTLHREATFDISSSNETPKDESKMDKLLKMLIDDCQVYEKLIPSLTYFKIHLVGEDRQIIEDYTYRIFSKKRGHNWVGTRKGLHEVIHAE